MFIPFGHHETNLDHKTPGIRDDKTAGQQVQDQIPVKFCLHLGKTYFEMEIITLFFVMHFFQASVTRLNAPIVQLILCSLVKM